MVMPSFEFEDKLNGLVVGIDEAGRGPWAGPVVAGAVVFLKRNIDNFLLDNLNDSKKLSIKKREILYDKIMQAKEKGDLRVGIGQASAEEIDNMNILQATFLAMQRAFGALECKPDFAIVDGNQKPERISCDCITLVKGDALSYSVAAASVVAKVYRDKIMADLAKRYPYYGFEKNAGYGTKAHVEGLSKHGIIQGIHRVSYKPVQKFLYKVAA